MLRVCILAFALFASTLAVPKPAATECFGVYKLIADKCLFVDPYADANYEEARYFCQNFGGDLVSIDSFSMYKQILSYINTNNLESRNYWIGATDKIDGEWFWLDGSRVTLGSPYWAVYGYSSNNYAQEPTNGGTVDYDCLQLDASRFLYYDDDNCNNLKSIICEDLSL